MFPSLLKVSATKSRAIGIEVSTAISQIKECLNQSWHLDLEYFLLILFSPSSGFGALCSGLILGSGHAVEIIPQSLIPVLSLCLCQDHLVLTFPHFSWTCPEWQMGAKLVKDWKTCICPLSFWHPLGVLILCHAAQTLCHTCVICTTPPWLHFVKCSQRSLAPLLHSLLLARFLCVLCAGNEKLGGWIPAPPACGLPIYPLWTHEELLVTRSDEAASFSGNPGTAATFHLKSPAPPTCCRLWSQVSRLSVEEDGLTGTLHLPVPSRRRGSASNADWKDAPWVLCVQKVVVVSVSW